MSCFTRIVVEQSFKNHQINTNEIIINNSDSDSDDDVQQESNTIIYYFCNNPFCKCFMAFTAYHNTSIKKISKYFIKFLLYSIITILTGRAIYLFTMIYIFYEHNRINTFYFHDNIGDFIFTSILGLLMLLGTLFAFGYVVAFVILVVVIMMIMIIINFYLNKTDNIYKI